MSAEECRRFFQAADRYPHNPAHPLIEYTAAVIFRLQYSTGMRPQEARLLRRQDLDFAHCTIYIADSKRHKDRCIAVEPGVMEMCRNYDRIARGMYPGTEIFFPNRNGNRHGAQAISTLFHKCREMAGNLLLPASPAAWPGISCSVFYYRRKGFPLPDWGLKPLRLPCLQSFWIQQSHREAGRNPHATTG